MKEQPIQKCKLCKEPAYDLSERKRCLKHHRLDMMRTNAKRKVKYAPSVPELEKIVPSNMICQCCNNKMTWVARQSTRGQTASLQHDRSGQIKIICVSCNSRHAAYPGDTFYDFDQTKKICADCKIIKNLSEFFKNKNDKFKGKHWYCKPCSLERLNKWKKSKIQNSQEINTMYDTAEDQISTKGYERERLADEAWSKDETLAKEAIAVCVMAASVKRTEETDEAWHNEVEAFEKRFLKSVTLSGCELDDFWPLAEFSPEEMLNVTMRQAKFDYQQKLEDEGY